MMRGILFVGFTLVCSVLCQNPLSSGAQTCFDKHMKINNEKVQIRRVKLSFCNTTGNTSLIKLRIINKKKIILNDLLNKRHLVLLNIARLNANGGYPFDPNGMEIRIGNVLFNKKTARTVLLKETEVQICMFGKVRRFTRDQQSFYHLLI